MLLTSNLCGLVTNFGWLVGFNVGFELRWWAFADGLGLIPKDGAETCHHNFDPPLRVWLLVFGAAVAQSVESSAPDRRARVLGSPKYANGTI